MRPLPQSRRFSEKEIELRSDQLLGYLTHAQALLIRAFWFHD